MELAKLDTNITLYKSGTYTLKQAAARSGMTEEQFTKTIQKYSTQPIETQAEYIVS